MQSIFNRYEKKYLVTREQYAALYNIIKRHMSPDRYGEYLVQNLYYDTEDWDIIRASIEKPLYKEKMRLRSYGVPGRDGELFLELKKKFGETVYKRRISVPAMTLHEGTLRSAVSERQSQIARELDYYMKSSAVFEKIFISYRREAFAGISDEGLRVTFDTDILFRLDCLNFNCPGIGHTVLPHGKTLMEIKTPGAMPIWFARALCENAVFPTAFSKYGICYTDYILKQSYANAQTERKVPISA